jgi:hypothetical protein
VQLWVSEALLNKLCAVRNLWALATLQVPSHEDILWWGSNILVCDQSPNLLLSINVGGHSKGAWELMARISTVLKFRLHFWGKRASKAWPSEAAWLQVLAPLFTRKILHKSFTFHASASFGNNWHLFSFCEDWLRLDGPSYLSEQLNVIFLLLVNWVITTVDSMPDCLHDLCDNPAKQVFYIPLYRRGYQVKRLHGSGPEERCPHPGLLLISVANCAGTCRTAGWAPTTAYSHARNRRGQVPPHPSVDVTAFTAHSCCCTKCTKCRDLHGITRDIKWRSWLST